MKLSDIQLTNINEGRRCISFSAFDGQKSIVCEVSFEAMDHAEQAQSTLNDERLDQFERLQPRIVEAVARKHFGRGAFGALVMVTSTDLNGHVLTSPRSVDISANAVS